jgi:phosphoadenosine phosphosulfate reductase
VSPPVQTKGNCGCSLEAEWLGSIQAAAEGWPAERILQWANETYGERVAIASAFGVEGIALIDIASRVWQQLRVFVLDTAFLFPETSRLIDEVETRYGISVERALPALTPETQAALCGPELWKRNADLCCYIRKVDPLRSKPATLSAWVTSIRRDQTPERAGIAKIGWDGRFQLVQISPLADWSIERVWAYVRERGLPYNPLHDRQYPSIGCTHCTRAVHPGEDPRAGRWPESNKARVWTARMERRRGSIALTGRWRLRRRDAHTPQSRDVTQTFVHQLLLLNFLLVIPGLP